MVGEILLVQRIQCYWWQVLSHLSSHRFNIALIFFGILLRVKLYLANNSFRLDEAWLALDISTRTFSKIILAKIFSYDLPTPPPGFVLIEKAFITLFGNNEYAFRLFPLLCGIASLFLFYELLKKSVDRFTVSLALFFFVCSDILIYNSSQLKQYSSGVFVVLLLYHLMLRVDSLKKMTISHSMGYGLAGAIAITMLYPSVFILAGIGVTQIASAFYKKEWEKFRELLFFAFLWFTVFIIIYAVYCYYMFHNQIMQQGTNPYFVWSFENAQFLFGWFTQVFLVRTVGLVPFWIGLYFILAGAILLMRRNKKTFSHWLYLYFSFFWLLH